MANDDAADALQCFMHFIKIIIVDDVDCLSSLRYNVMMCIYVRRYDLLPGIVSLLGLGLLGPN